MDYTNIFVSAISEGGNFPINSILDFLRQISNPSQITFYDFNCWISKAVFDELLSTCEHYDRKKGTIGWKANASHPNIMLTCSIHTVCAYHFYRVTLIKTGLLQYVFKGETRNSGTSNKNIFFLTANETIIFR